MEHRFEQGRARLSGDFAGRSHADWTLISRREIVFVLRCVSEFYFCVHFTGASSSAAGRGMARTGNYPVLPSGITSHYVLAIVRYRVRA
jgi:hypothetical protein